VTDLGSNSWLFVAYRYVPRGAWRAVGQLQEPVRIEITGEERLARGARDDRFPAVCGCVLDIAG